MSKYIKLADAIYVDCILINEIDCEDCPFCAIERAECRMVEWLESLPTIDIVLCKDCKHYFRGNWCEILKAESMFKNGFCAYGERTDNE